MIVVDSNIIAYFYLPGPFSKAAETLFSHDPEWAAPPLWRSEFRNILAGYLRRNSLNLAQALSIQTEAEIILAGNEIAVASEDVLKLVSSSDCSAYDCEFVALAKKLGTKLITMDKKILKAFPKIALALETA